MSDDALATDTGGRWRIVLDPSDELFLNLRENRYELLVERPEGSGVAMGGFHAVVRCEVGHRFRWSQGPIGSWVPGIVIRIEEIDHVDVYVGRARDLGFVHPDVDRDGVR